MKIEVAVRFAPKRRWNPAPIANVVCAKYSYAAAPTKTASMSSMSLDNNCNYILKTYFNIYINIYIIFKCFRVYSNVIFE